MNLPTPRPSRRGLYILATGLGFVAIAVLMAVVQHARGGAL